MDSNSYVYISDSRLKLEKDKSILLSLPLTRKDQRQSNPITYMDAWIPKSVSALVIDRKDQKKMYVFKLWIYTKLENSWWEVDKRLSKDRDKYDLKLYEPRTYSENEVIQFNRYNILISNEANSKDDLLKSIKNILPKNISTDSIIKSITVDKNNHNIYEYSYDVVFKNGQKANFKSQQLGKWIINMNNKSLDIYEGTFELFLFALSGELENELENLLSVYDRNYQMSDSSKVYMQGEKIEKRIKALIAYLKKMNASKALEYEKRMNENNSLSLNQILKNFNFFR